MNSSYQVKLINHVDSTRQLFFFKIKFCQLNYNLNHNQNLAGFILRKSMEFVYGRFRVQNISDIFPNEELSNSNCC